MKIMLLAVNCKAWLVSKDSCLSSHAISQKHIQTIRTKSLHKHTPIESCKLTSVCNIIKMFS